jgi:predicted aspartyl protease
MTSEHFRRVGRLYAWLALYAAALGAAVTPARADDCKVLRIATVPMTIDQEGRVTVPVGINGSERRFLLSTGTGYSNIDADVADSLGLHQWKIKATKEIYVSGVQAQYFVHIPDLAIGAARISNVQLVVRPERKHMTGNDGVLGSETLQIFDVELNFSKSELTLFSRKHCSNRVVYWTNDYARVPFHLSPNGHGVFSATLDGKTVYAALETGRAQTVLSARTAQESFGLSQSSPGITPVLPVLDDPRASNRLLFSHRFDLLDLGGVKVKNPLIYIRTDDSKQAFEENHAGSVRQNDAKYVRHLDVQELYLGTEVLRQLRLYIAYGEEALYVSSANAEPPSGGQQQ